MTYCVLMVLDILGNLIFASLFPLRLVVMSLAYILRYTISFCIFLTLTLGTKSLELFRKCIQFSPNSVDVRRRIFFCSIQLFYLENVALSVSKEEFCSNIIAVISLFALQFQSTCL